MSYDPKKVFVKTENNAYMELTYKEFCELKNNEEDFDERRFIPIQGTLIEVSPSDYKRFYRSYERKNYLEELDEINGLISVAEFFMCSDEQDAGTYEIDGIIDRHFENQTLYKCIAKLKPKEQKIIILMFFYELKQTDIAKIVGMSQSGVSRAKKRILKKLKKLMEE